MIENIYKNYVYKTTFKKHNDIKDSLLEAIDQTFAQSHKSENSKISKTDFFKMPEPVAYADIFFRNYAHNITEIAHLNGCNEWQINDVWFQQYLKDDTHHWHTHSKCHFTNVYYLELPNKTMTTQIYDPVEQNYLDIECNEGEVITFPAWLPHRSLPIDTEERKTIISYNISLDITNTRYITIQDDIEEL